jgi:hypothetical protein
MIIGRNYFMTYNWVQQFLSLKRSVSKQKPVSKFTNRTPTIRNNTHFEVAS